MLKPFSSEPGFKQTESPNATWKLGDGLSDTELARQWKEEEQLGYTTLKTDEIEKPLLYRFLISAIVPRPIAFVSTLSGDGVPNLSPFSYFSMVSHNPPLCSVSFTLSPQKPKDTRENIKDTKQFVVSIINEPFVEAANATSIDAPPEIDEWIVSGLTPTPSTLVKPPRVLESALSLECELYHFLDIPAIGGDAPANTMVLGHIRAIHVRNSVLTGPAEPGKPIEVDPTKFRAVSRLGGTTFARIGEGYSIPRPSWRQLEGEVRELIAKREKEENPSGGSQL
ncbi:hypothetical protein SCHPADRAFT_902211 [Schizopora paradoxa]|uniref:Flavin reductase like domain-containing protein n=1 Tax=Schizopora paradoxa TaxID=27342 RepID=A0A0H2SF56_9AGAM|nr:hypothetical protein SCHPADRAFT_902211 [Schizopora paradoxa]